MARRGPRPAQRSTLSVRSFLLSPFDPATWRAFLAVLVGTVDHLGRGRGADDPLVDRRLAPRRPRRHPGHRLRHRSRLDTSRGPSAGEWRSPTHGRSRPTSTGRWTTRAGPPWEQWLAQYADRPSTSTSIAGETWSIPSSPSPWRCWSSLLVVALWSAVLGLFVATITLIGLDPEQADSVVLVGREAVVPESCWSRRL